MIWVFLLLFLNVNGRELFEMNDTNVDKMFEMITIKLCIGEPMQCISSILFDTGSFALWVPDDDLNSLFSEKFNCSRSETCTQRPDDYTRIFYGNGKVEGYLTNDQISLSLHKTKTNFVFLLAKAFNINNYINGIAGFGKNYFDRFLNLSISDKEMENFSIIHKLYNDKVIKKKSFFFNHKTKALHIGEPLEDSYPKCFALSPPKDTTTKEYEYYMERKDLWTCGLKSIAFENGTVINSEEGEYSVFFDSGSNAFKVPTEMFEIINAEYRGKLKGCLENIKRHRKRLMCSRDLKIDSIEKININLGSFEIQLIPTDILQIDSMDARNIFYRYHLVPSQSDYEIMIPASFFHRYDFIFDMEDGSVGLKVKSNGSRKGVDKIMKLSSLILIFGVILLLFSYKKMSEN